MQTGTWYHVCRTRNGTAQKVYVNGVLDSSETRTCTFTTANLYAMNDLASGWIDGRIAAIKIYTAELTAEEIANEMWTYTPRRTANLNTWSPCFAGATERVAHVVECRPEICTLDCGTMNFNEADYVMVNTPGMLRDMARRMTAAGVRIEIEAFDTGHLWLAKELVKEGAIPDPVLVQLCMGVPWGAPDDLNTFMAMVNNVPQGWHYSAFSLGRNQMAYVAAAILAGGNVRVGLEDNLWLDKGVLATNAQLVERAATIIENMGARVITPAEVRARLKLEKRAPLPR